MDPVNNHSTPEQKIALYRSLFRGRSDVYARRFVAKKTGKAGYSPVCGNEWVRGICEKPKIKCSDCSHQCWNGITDDVIRWHLSGQDSTGKEFILSTNQENDTTSESNSKIFTGQIIDYGDEVKDTIRTDYSDFVFAKNDPFRDSII